MSSLGDVNLEAESTGGDAENAEYKLLYKTYNTQNKYIQSDWTTYKLPGTLMEAMEKNKKTAVLNRFPVFSRGLSPCFVFLKSKIPPQRDWYTFVGKVLEDEANEKMCLIQTEDPRYDMPMNGKNKFDVLIHRKQTEPSMRPQFKLTTEQLDAKRGLLTLLCGDHAPNFGSVLLNGQAGCGKTYLLSEIVSLKKYRPLRIIYTTTTNLLCGTVYDQFKPGLEALTVCGLLMQLYKLNFNACTFLQDLLKHIPAHAFASANLNVDEIHFESDTLHTTSVDKSKRLWIRLLKRIRPHKVKHVIIFIDEYSLLSDGVISLIHHTFKTIEKYLPFKFIIIYSGDINQIQPLFSHDASSDFTFMTSLVDQVYNFKIQKRIENVEYLDFLKSILVTESPAQLVRNTFGHLNSRLVDYNYNVQLISEIPPYEEFEQVIEYFETWKLHEICKPMFFSYTNVELHYNNIAIAMSIYNKLKSYTVIEPHSFVQFQILRYLCGKKIYTPNKLTMYDTGEIPILPLVKGFPYKILSSKLTLPRSSIVYLIYWTKSFAIVYHRDSKSLYKLPIMEFSMNLTRNALVGFPLQMYVAETSYSAQGLTIGGREIYVNPSNTTRPEFYVIMSRVTNANQIKSIHVPK